MLWCIHPDYVIRVQGKMKTSKLFHIFTSMLVLFFLFIFPSLFLSCSREGEGGKEGPEYEINKEYTSGPCTLVIRISRQEISIAESITMIIDVTVDKEYNVKLPEFGENLEQFKITDFYEPGRQLAGNERIAVQQEYILEPFLSGTYTIPVMRIQFWSGSDDPADPHILESEEQTITVTSLLDEDMEELALKDITGPVLPPPPDLTWVIFVIAGIAVAGGGISVLIIILVRKKQKERPVITIPAHELAYQQLEALIARDYIEKGEVKLFYIEISTILRRYIENRFHLHAPGQTTEEFLYDLKNSSLLQNNLKSILKEFLFHCDQVKFATYKPTPGEIQKTFDTCKDFIVTTEDVNTRIEEPAVTSSPEIDNGKEVS